MAEANIYQGVGYRAAAVPGQGTRGGVGVAGDVVSEEIYRGTQALARSADRAVAAWEGEVEKGKLMKASLDMKQVAYDHDVELERRQNLPDGAEGSFFTSDGKLKRDEIVKFLKPYQERIDRAGSDLLEPENQIEMARQRGAMSMELGRQAELLGERLSRKKQEQLCRDNYELSRATGDYARAAAFARAGAEEGYWTVPRAKLMELAVGKAALAERGGVRLRGYGGGGGDGVQRGAQAAIAAQAEKDGYEMPPEKEEGREGGGAGGQLTLDVGSVQEPVGQLTLDSVGRGTVEEAGGTGQLTLDVGGKEVGQLRVDSAGRAREEEEEGQLTLEVGREVPSGDWVMGGDDSGLIKAMPQRDLATLLEEWGGEATRLTRTEDDATGEVKYKNTPVQEEAVQRAAAYANANGGEVTEEIGKVTVAQVAAARVAENPDVTVEQVMEEFKGSGLYETLGGGSAEVGEAEARDMVSEVRGRVKGERGVLNGESIKRLVEARLDEMGVDEAAESRVVSRMATGGWDRWEDMSEVERARLTREREIYNKYAREYNPEGGYDDKWEEYKAKVEGFKKWYLKGKYADRVAAERRARGAWYETRIAEELRKNMVVGKDGKVGYGGYANEVEVARKVLTETPPANLGTKEWLAEADRVRGEEAKLSAKFREGLVVARERLARGREETAAREAEAKAAAARERAEEKARERAEKEAERAREKAEAAAERARERAEEVARRRVMGAERDGEWAWDKTAEVPDGALPACTIPEADYKELVERGGYDGEGVLYVRVAGGRFVVTGVNKRGCVLLNTPALMKVQKKPNARRGEKWVLRNKLRYRYYVSRS